MMFQPDHGKKWVAICFSLGIKIIYIIIADYYSLWPEVYLLSKANSLTVIDALKQTFARHGIPEELVSDNGSQYKSRTFRKFIRENGM